MPLGLKPLRGALFAVRITRAVVNKRLKQRSAFVVSVALLAVAGCASGGSPLLQTAHMVGTRALLGPAPDGLPPRPDPRFRYLRVEMKDRTPAMWVLGYLDQHHMGAIEVWYSAQGEMLKLQNGRIVATQGLPVDWAAVRFSASPPAWADLGTAVATFGRERDELPRYRYGLREHVVLTAVVPPPASYLPASVHPDMAARYAWFEETALPANGLGGASLPAASALSASRFAWGLHLGQPMVVYSEQCLAPGVCLRIQRWPVQDGAS